MRLNDMRVLLAGRGNVLPSIALFSAILGLATPALAQDASDERVAEDYAYIRVGAGVSFVSDLEQDITLNPNVVLPALPVPATQTIGLDTGFIASAAIGFDYADGIRTELEYRYATTSIDAVSDGGPLPAAVNDDINAHFIFTNFYFDFANSSAFTPFIGAGVGGAFVTNQNDVRDAALAWQARAGVSWALSDGFSADLDYNYTQSTRLAYGPTDDGFLESAELFHADGDRYQASSVMLSLRKAF